MKLPSNRGRVMFAMLAGIALLVACGPGGTCESDEERARREETEFLRQQAFLDALQTATPTATPVDMGTPSPTATPVDMGTPSPTATPVDGALPPPTLTTSGDLMWGGGTIGLGFDHPPFGPGNGGLPGASVGVVCGNIPGIPDGSIVTIIIDGGTGAPPDVNGPVGPGGDFLFPFPIQSYGSMHATIDGVANPGGDILAPPSALPSVTLDVGPGDDVLCAP